MMNLRLARMEDMLTHLKRCYSAVSSYFVNAGKINLRPSLDLSYVLRILRYMDLHKCLKVSFMNVSEIVSDTNFDTKC